MVAFDAVRARADVYIAIKAGPRDASDPAFTANFVEPFFFRYPPFNILNLGRMSCAAIYPVQHQGVTDSLALKKVLFNFFL